MAGFVKASVGATPPPISIPDPLEARIRHLGRELQTLNAKALADRSLRPNPVLERERARLTAELARLVENQKTKRGIHAMVARPDFELRKSGGAFEITAKRALAAIERLPPNREQESMRAELRSALERLNRPTPLAVNQVPTREALLNWFREEATRTLRLFHDELLTEVRSMEEDEFKVRIARESLGGFTPYLLLDGLGAEGVPTFLTPKGRTRMNAFVKRQPQAVRDALKPFVEAYSLLQELGDRHGDFVAKEAEYSESEAARRLDKAQEGELDRITTAGSYTVPLTLVVSLRPGRGNIAEIDEITAYRGIAKFPGAGLSISYVRGAGTTDSHAAKKAAEARARAAAERSLTDPEPIRLGTLVCPRAAP